MQAVITQSAAGGGGGPIFYETLEGTGYSAAGWSSTGTVDPDYSTSGLSLEDSQCLLLASSCTATNTLTSSYDEVWVKFMFRTDDNSGTPNLIKMFDASSNYAGGLWLNGGVINIEHGDATTTSSTLSTNITYYIWIHYLKGTSTGVFDLYVATSSTIPGSPTTTINSGTRSNYQVHVVTLYSPNHWFDHIWLNNAITGFTTW
jgi:hypothetical protein